MDKAVSELYACLRDRKRVSFIQYGEVTLTVQDVILVKQAVVSNYTGGFFFWYFTDVTE